MKIRKQLRVPIPIKIRFKRENNQHYEEARIDDISWGGILLQTSPRPAIGSRLLMEFDIPNQPVMLEVWGTVVRLHDGDAEKTSGVGVEFDELDVESRGQIQVLVDHWVRVQFQK